MSSVRSNRSDDHTGDFYMSRKCRRNGVRKETLRRQMRARMVERLNAGMAYVHKTDRMTPNAFTHPVKTQIEKWKKSNRY